MNKEDQIYDLLERLYIELQDTKKELKEDILNVRTELKEEILSVRTELKEDIRVLNDNQMIIFDKLEKIGSDVETIKEDIVRLKSVR